MRVPEIKALTRERGLRGYSQMRKAQIFDLLRNYSPQTTRSEEYWCTTNEFRAFS